MEAWRALRHNRGFFALAVVLLGSGMAAVTVIFAVADALLLRPMAVAQPEFLVRFVSMKPQLGTRSSFNLDLFEAWRQHSTSFQKMGLAAEVNTSFRDGNQVERAQVSVASPEWLETFGVAPVLGTALADGQSAVLSYRFWQRRYGGRSDVLGRGVEIRGKPFTITGVMPAGFNGTTVESGPDLWIALAALQRYALDPVMGVTDLDFEVVARLKPGVPREAAREEAYRIYRNAAKLDRDMDLSPQEFNLEPLLRGASRLRPQASGAIWFAAGAAALLALMVCVNLSGLLLARVLGRGREFAVRQALGSSNTRLAGLVVGEVLCVVTVATLLGGALTFAGLRTVEASLPPVRLLSRTVVPMALRLEPSGRVFALVGAFCLVAMGIIALLPAWRASRAGGFVGGLRQTRGSTGSAGYRWLLAVQVAFCTMLVLAAMLGRNSLDLLRRQSQTARIVNCDVDSLLVPGMTPERFARAMERWKKKVESLPGVQKAAFSSIRRLRGSGYKMTVVPAGERAQPAQFMNTSTLPVGEGYLETNNIALLAGRQIAVSERYSDAKLKAVLVNEAFARQYGGPQSVLGRRFGPGRLDQPADALMLVVGVTANFVYRSMRESEVPVIYSSLGSNWNPITLTVRSDLPTAALAAPLREALRQTEPQLVVEDITDMQQDVEASLWNERTIARLSTLFAALAAAIVAAGLFGFLAYLVAARRREIGIRLAVGATPRRAATDVLVQGLWPVAFGLGAGLAGGWALTHLVQSFLFGVRTLDPVVTAVVALGILTVSLLACAAPAWRASRISPAVALRAE